MTTNANTTRTVETTRYINARLIQIMIDKGLNPLDALRDVCGAEKVDAMIDDLYHRLREKGQR